LQIGGDALQPPVVEEPRTQHRVDGDHGLGQ
jgi:hypothetical protein